MMLNNLKVDKTAVMQTKETAMPAVNQKVEDTTITGGDTNTDNSVIDNIPMVKGMNPILKYSLLGISGALIIFLGYRMIFRRK